MGDKREFGCPRERKRHGQSCVSMTCSRTLREDEDGKKGCSEKFGLCPPGDTDPGLKRDVAGAPPWLRGGKWGTRGLRLILPDSSSGCVSPGVRLEEVVWSLRGIPPAGEGFGLQRRRSRVTDTTTWQHSCLKIEETEIKSGWCKCHRGDLLKT